jgi:hypothetical protein
MTLWDVLADIVKVFPPLAAAILLAAAGVVFIIGFARHGMNFVKYGFKQKEIGDLAQKIDGLRTEFKNDLEVIKTNHFGHLKNYLGVLNGILLDKGVIDNESKARLDNELRGM